MTFSVRTSQLNVPFFYLPWFSIFKYDGLWYVVKTAYLKRCKKCEFRLQTGVVHGVCKRLGEFGDSASVQFLLFFSKSKVVQVSLQKVRVVSHWAPHTPQCNLGLRLSGEGR